MLTLVIDGGDARPWRPANDENENRLCQYRVNIESELVSVINNPTKVYG